MKSIALEDFLDKRHFLLFEIKPQAKKSQGSRFIDEKKIWKRKARQEK